MMTSFYGSEDVKIFPVLSTLRFLCDGPDEPSFVTLLFVCFSVHCASLLAHAYKLVLTDTGTFVLVELSVREVHCDSPAETEWEKLAQNLQF